MKVAGGFVSFTEVEPGAHRSYNEWHLFDHLPEQLPLPGVVWGQRWVVRPGAAVVAEPPLDRVHYVTLYLMAEPLDEAVRGFFALAGELRAAGRFHEQRTSHLSGLAPVVSAAAAPRALVAPEVVPYRPHRGVHVSLGSGAFGGDAAGTWTFDLEGAPLVVSWLDGDPQATAPESEPGARFSAVAHTIDPFGPWDWFEA
jgi:hypothetical protein